MTTPNAFSFPEQCPTAIGWRGLRFERKEVSANHYPDDPIQYICLSPSRRASESFAVRLEFLAADPDSQHAAEHKDRWLAKLITDREDESDEGESSGSCAEEALDRLLRLERSLFCDGQRSLTVGALELIREFSWLKQSEEFFGAIKEQGGEKK